MILWLKQLLRFRRSPKALSQPEFQEIIDRLARNRKRAEELRDQHMQARPRRRSTEDRPG